MAKQWSIYSMAVKLIAGTIIVLMTFYCVVTLAPWIETTYFPVVGKLRFERIEPAPTDATHSYIWVTYTKLRNCDYKDTVWYRRAADGSLAFVYLDLRPLNKRPPVTRPLGLQEAGPWEVGLRPDQIRDVSVVEIHHQCVGETWASTTRWYP